MSSSKPYSNARRNSAMLRLEAQCQARYRRNVFVTGLILGMLFTMSVIHVLRTHTHLDGTQPTVVVAKARTINPLVMYARGESGASSEEIIPSSKQDNPF